MRKDLLEITEVVNKSFPMNVFHTTFKPHHFLKLHWHEHFELVLIERGSATYHIGGQSLPVQEGQLLFINSGELHAVSGPQDGFTIYAIVFHPSLVGIHTSDMQTLGLVSPYTAGKQTFITQLQPGGEHYERIHQAVMELVTEFKHQEEGYEHAVRAYLQLLFTWYSRWFTEKREDHAPIAGFITRTERFKELMLQIEQRYGEKWSVDQAAKAVHLSPYHFCRMFKQMTGLTFVQYLNVRRVQEAERFLRSTALTVSEIAERVGCGSINSFSKLFKQYKGISPVKIRDRK